MKLTHTHQYAQNIDAIYTSCMNADFIKAKMKALGARNIEVTIQQKTDSVVIEITRETPVEVPNTLKSLIKPWVKMTQTEVWKGTAGGPFYCNIDIKLQGVPLNIQGQMKLANTEGGTAVVSITDVNCTIPFIGKALTNFIVGTSKEAIEKEFGYIEAHVK